MTVDSTRAQQQVDAGDKVSFEYGSLPSYLKLSNWLSWRAITKNLVPGSWLDIMCGSQAILQQSQLKNRKITRFVAIDQEIEPEVADKGIEVKLATLSDSLPFEDESFDNITFINALEHLFADQEMLDECYRVLRPGGLLQVIVPTWFGKGWLELVAFRLRVQEQIYHGMNDHKMYYDERTLWPKAVRAGFMPADIRLNRIKFRCSLLMKARK